jgi:putative transposase
LQFGEFELESTRDRYGTFEPKIVAKRQLIITDELEENVIAMYARGMSTRNISDYVKEMYAIEISATKISNITDRIIPAMNEWRTRPLEGVYPFVFLDCMHYKVRDSGGVESRAIYNILGVNRDGRNYLIGVYLSEN